MPTALKGRHFAKSAIVLAILMGLGLGAFIVAPSRSALADAGNNYPWGPPNGAVSIPGTGDWGYLTCPSNDTGCMAGHEKGSDGKTYGYADPWGYALRYCTSWVAWALHDRNGFEMPRAIGNASDWKSWAQNHGYTVDQNPAVGAVAWFGTSANHVAWVSALNSNGTVQIEEYNNPAGSGTYNTRAITRTSAWYIHFKDIPQDPTPPPVPWNFENLEGGAHAVSPYQGNVGVTPASVVFNGQLYVYYYSVTGHNLRVAYTTPGWVFDTVDGLGGGSGKINADVGQVPSAIVFNNVMYVFYYDNTDGNLRMAWSSDGRTWQAETLDGDPGSLSGYNANVGQSPFVVDYDNSLQVFYYQPDQGALRHAWSPDGSSWNFETLDGNSGSISHFSGNVGLDPSAVVYDGTLQVFYYNQSQGDLRHAWSDANGWHFENLDGDAGSIGHSGDNTGTNPTAYVYQGDLGVLYYDKTQRSLRHAWSDTVGWHFETLMGGSSSILGGTVDVGAMSTVVIDGTTLQAFVYQSQYGDLDHIWNDGSWHEENLDGAGGLPSGRINANVGLDPVAIMFGSTLDVFYYDADHGALRHAWAD